MADGGDFSPTQYPRATVSGRSNYVFHCSVPNCPFYCRNKIPYDRHIRAEHFCPVCELYCISIGIHVCNRHHHHDSANHQVGDVGGAEADAESVVSASTSAAEAVTTAPERTTTERLELSIFREFSRSHHGSIISYVHRFTAEDIVRIDDVFSILYEPLKKLLEQLIRIRGSLRISLKLGVELEQFIVQAEEVIRTKIVLFFFQSEHHILFTPDNISNTIMACADDIATKQSTFIQNGSNFHVKSIKSLEVKIAEYRPLESVQIRAYVKMPFRAQGIINFKTKTECFKVCVTAGLFWEEAVNANKLIPKNRNYNLKNCGTWRRYYSKLDFTGVCTECQDISGIYESITRFEINNKVCINILSHENKRMLVIRKSVYSYSSTVNLFLIKLSASNGGGGGVEPAKFHFVLVNCLDKFLARLSPNKCNTRVCTECLRYFSTEKPFRAHIANQCKLSAINNTINIAKGNLPNDYQSTRCIIDEPEEKIPPVGAKLEFFWFDLTLPFPFVIYATFQTKDRGDGNGKMAEEAASDLGGYTFVIVRRDSMEQCNTTTKNAHVVTVEHYTAEEGVTEHFFRRMFFWAQDILTVIRNTNLFRQPTMEELIEYESVSHCQLCQSAFTNTCKVNSQYSYKIHWDYENWQDGLTSIPEEEQELILGEDTNLLHSRSTRPVLRTFHHNHFADGGKIEAVICQYCNLRILSKTCVPVICHSTKPINFKSIITGISSGLYKTSDIKILAKSPTEIIQAEIVSKNMYIPKLGGVEKFPCRPLAEREFRGSRKAKIRITNSMNFVNEPISSIFAATLGLGESSSAGILGKCLKTFFPRIITSTDKLQEVTQLICKLPSLQNILQCGLLDVREESCNSARLVSLKSNIEWQKSRQESDQLDNEQFCSFNLMCKLFQIKDVAGLKQFYNCIESSMLACFWETYRQSAYNSFKLDPTGVATISAYTFQAFLYHSKTKIDMCRDPTITKLIKANIRGGICYNTTRIKRANNVWNTKHGGFDSGSPRSFLAHFDVNSMYPFTMKTFYFPSGKYEWMDRTELDALVFPPRQHWREITIEEPSRDVDYILEVDLLYPDDLHRDTASLPLGFQHLILSYFLKDQVLTSSSSSSSSNCEEGVRIAWQSDRKLMATCFDKTKYLVHGRLLRYFTSFGLKIGKIYRGIKFEQTNLFESYIDFLLLQRKNATNEILGNLNKACANNLSGKFVSSNKYWNSTVFCNSRAQCHKLTASPHCRDYDALSPDCSVFSMAPKRLNSNNVQLIGFSILELSKLYLYYTYYQKCKNAFDCDLLYVDTDGYFMEIFCYSELQFLDVIARNNNFFDFSKLPESHILFKLYGSKYPNLRLIGRQVAGKLKVESICIGELIALRAKEYSVSTFTGDGQKIQCGSVSKAVSSHFTHDTYRNAVIKHQPVKIDMSSIHCEGSTIYVGLECMTGFNYLNIVSIFQDEQNNNYGSIPYGFCDPKKVFD